MVRSWRAGDLAALVRHADSRRVWRNLRDAFPHPYTEETGRRWLQLAPRQVPETQFAIEADGEAVGGIGLVPGTDVERVGAEIGYWLGEAAWGRGLATAAVQGLTAWAFEHLGLSRVFALPYAENLASRRVLEKAGYALEGILRCSAVKEGRVLDQALYAATNPPPGRLLPRGGEGPG